MSVGQRYRIRYRKIDSFGNCVGGPLIEGEGILLAKYGANHYDHLFMLDNNEQVWCTSNSVYPLSDQRLATLSILADTEFDLSVLEEVSTFLNGLGIVSTVSGPSIIIDFSGAAVLKALLRKMYSSLILDD